MKTEKGVQLFGLKIEMRPVLIEADKIYEKHGQELFITCTTGGIHSPGSLHYYGYAIDLRTKFFKDQSEKQEVKRELSEVLRFPFDVVLESTHIHVEFDIIKKLEEQERKCGTLYQRIGQLFRQS